MHRQEFYRQEYSRLKPGWRHSLFALRDVVDRHTRPGARILDIGCGHADFLAPIYARTAHVVGCDPDTGALGLNTTIAMRAAGLADDLPFEDATFDAVVLVWVLEHLERPARAFGEIRRVLKPGGGAIFLTPNAWNYNTWLIRLVPPRARDRLARGWHGRQEHDTYPVRYRINTVSRIHQTLSGLGFRKSEMILHGDPTYISLNRALFKIACGLESILDRPRFVQARVHLIGVYQKAV